MRPYDTIIQNKKTIITIYITSQQRYRNRNKNIHIKFEFDNCESVCEILLLQPDETRSIRVCFSVSLSLLAIYFYMSTLYYFDFFVVFISPFSVLVVAPFFLFSSFHFIFFLISVVKSFFLQKRKTLKRILRI